MELKANERKVVNTQPLDYLFTQGEAGVDCIPIILPLQYGEIDLSALRWSIQLVSEQDTFISKPLSVQAGEDSLTVFWKVDEDCTAVPGRIKLTIVGISEDKTEVIKFDGREIMIKAAAYGNFAPTADSCQPLWHRRKSMRKSCCCGKTGNTGSAYSDGKCPNGARCCGKRAIYRRKRALVFV